jgi:hypothetical protein
MLSAGSLVHAACAQLSAFCAAIFPSLEVDAFVAIRSQLYVASGDRLSLKKNGHQSLGKWSSFGTLTPVALGPCGSSRLFVSLSIALLAAF